MDGVFKISNKIPAPHYVVFQPKTTMSSIEFTSRFHPAFEESHLLAISNADPFATFTYYYAGKAEAVSDAGRCTTESWAKLPVRKWGP